MPGLALSKHLPHAERRPSPATPRARAWPPPTRPGPAFQRARSQQYGLHGVATPSRTTRYNRTRFAIICLPHTWPRPPLSGKDCTSLIISVPNRPGAVHDPAGAAEKHGVSMTRFESRPARTGQWEYYFTSTSKATLLSPCRGTGRAAAPVRVLQGAGHLHPVVSWPEEQPCLNNSD